MSPHRVCQTWLADFNPRWRFLLQQATQLRTQEQRLSAELTAELATRSPNAGATDAAHEATLREQRDLQQRIFSLAESRPMGPGGRPCH
jgi:hypothetical protein